MNSDLSCNSVTDELQVLESVFCQSGEFTLHDLNAEAGSARYTITVSDSSNNEQSPNLGSTIAITFAPGPCYPKYLPDISLTSDLLTRKAADKMKTSLIEYASEHLCGEPMAMEIVEWIRLHFKEYANYENQQEMIPESQGTCVTSLLRLDHMRAKGRYIKTLTSWCEELGIMGRIIFVERLILILLEGHQARVKEFILRLKTQKVDVDSSGKACKEKMMSVLSEKPTDKNRFSSFEVSEMGSVQELRKYFDSLNLSQLYDEHLQPLCRHPLQGAIR
nr:RWD domain-containing protein 3-like [Lytechinus pictus]